MSVEQQDQLEYVFQPKSEREAIDYLAQVRDNLAHLSFLVQGPWMMPYCTYRKGGSLMLALLLKFLRYSEIVQSFLPVGSLDFVLYIIFLQNPIDAWV